MSQSDDLLPGIRQKILDGTLPKQNCHVTWYGHGTGQICVACERPIAADDVEVERDLPHRLAAVRRIHLVAPPVAELRRRLGRVSKRSIERAGELRGVAEDRGWGRNRARPVESRDRVDAAIPPGNAQ